MFFVLRAPLIFRPRHHPLCSSLEKYGKHKKVFFSLRAPPRTSQKKSKPFPTSFHNLIDSGSRPHKIPTYTYITNRHEVELMLMRLVLAP